MGQRIFGANICFNCTKACGGCSWSRSFEPVPGWTAEACMLPVTFNKTYREIDTYHVTACPEFDPDTRSNRTGDSTILSIEESQAFLAGSWCANG